MKKIEISFSSGGKFVIEDMPDKACDEIQYNIRMMAEWKGSFHIKNSTFNLEKIDMIEVFDQPKKTAKRSSVKKTREEQLPLLLG